MSDKTHYRFEFRGLTDPPEFQKIEAGPFTPEEAAIFGRQTIASLAVRTGRPWVGKWHEVKGPTLSWHLTVAAFIITVVVLACAAVRFLGVQ